MYDVDFGPKAPAGKEGQGIKTIPSKGWFSALRIFTFAYTYTIAASGRIDDTTPQLPVAFAIFCNLACIAIFFWFGQWLGESLRPIAVLQGAIQRSFPDEEDRARAQVGDLQGIGCSESS